MIAIDSDRLRAYLNRLSPAEVNAMLETGFGCSERELAPHEPKHRRERPPTPAPPHAYRTVTISTEDGVIVRCRVRNCQDETHRVRAALS